MGMGTKAIVYEIQTQEEFECLIKILARDDVKWSGENSFDIYSETAKKAQEVLKTGRVIFISVYRKDNTATWIY